MRRVSEKPNHEFKFSRRALAFALLYTSIERYSAIEAVNFILKCACCLIIIVYVCTNWQTSSHMGCTLFLWAQTTIPIQKILIKRQFIIICIFALHFFPILIVNIYIVWLCACAPKSSRSHLFSNMQFTLNWTALKILIAIEIVAWPAHHFCALQFTVILHLAAVISSKHFTKSESRTDLYPFVIENHAFLLFIRFATDIQIVG